MAATATRTHETKTAGGVVMTVEFGYITFDSDATVEVPTTVDRIFGIHFTETVSGGSADVPSVDETFVDGAYSVPATKLFTVDTGANSTRTFLYTLYGQ